MFAHLHVHSPFSLLDGASPLRTLVGRASRYEMSVMALTDHDNVSGLVEFGREAAAAGIKPVAGAEVTVEGGYHLTLLARNVAGYRSLCRILTRSHRGNPRGRPAARWEDLEEHNEGLFALSGCRHGLLATLIRQRKPDEALAIGRRYLGIFGRDRFFIELQNELVPHGRGINQMLVNMAASLGVGSVATNNVHYADKDDFPIHDVLTCIRTGTALEDVNPARRLNAENYLKSSAEMQELFREWPRAVEVSGEIAGNCEPATFLGEPLFPGFPDLPVGQTAEEFLRRAVMAGAAERYGKNSLSAQVRNRIDNELAIINKLGFAGYFLVVWDVARFARREGIRFAGRGSAADSAVAYCLGITSVDAIGRRLLFERFLSLERAQKPDVDIDFDARYRDKVADYVYEKYGSDHVASVCTFSTFQARSAVREVGKALGFPPGELDRLAKLFPHVGAADVPEALQKYPELRDSRLPLERYNQLFRLATAVAGLPRHVGTHLGGVVISRTPITDVTPLMTAAKGVAIAQFDKDSIEELGLIKLDLLSLRTLSAVEDAIANIKARESGFEYDRLSLTDAPTYAMLRSGETVGVFQLESPAQRALQSRLGADNIEDVVASVALIRPGPVEGNMVEPFIARRTGKEEISYLHPKLEKILAKTYGVVLYQEQVIEIATTIAGFSPGDADRLRRVMTHARSRQDMQEIGEEFVTKAVANGVEPEVAEVILGYIKGYAGYGFCEAHAAAFADTAYKTAFLIRHYPAEFLAALLSSQPMGFYPPSTLCVQARRRGIKILPPDVNASTNQYLVEDVGEGEKGIRVSLPAVNGMDQARYRALIQERGRGGTFRSIDDFLARVPLALDAVENLVLAGAFDALAGGNRRLALWTIRSRKRIPNSESRGGRGGRRPSPGPEAAVQLPLPFDMAKARIESGTGTSARLEASPRAGAGVRDFSALERFQHEFSVLGFGVTDHLLDFLRDDMTKAGFSGSRELSALPPGSKVRVAGVAIRPHRPPTRSGRTVVFLSLEDEWGLIDVTVFEHVYQRCGKSLFTSPVLAVFGILEVRGEGRSVTAYDAAPLEKVLSRVRRGR